MRTTRKFWVKSQDVSRVKYTVLQHLPVFQFDASNFHGDAQLVNSVYLDNVNCELYHGRLDKRPDAIAIRLRWYGSGDPSIVFVERKTHREGWKGETSVKERFVLKEANVLPYLNGHYTWSQVGPRRFLSIHADRSGLDILSRNCPPHATLSSLSHSAALGDQCLLVTTHAGAYFIVFRVCVLCRWRLSSSQRGGLTQTSVVLACSSRRFSKQCSRSCYGP